MQISFRTLTDLIRRLAALGPDGVRILPTEGGHGGFAPVDAEDDRLLAGLRARFGRVSAERVVSGPGLAAIRAVRAAAEGREASPETDAALWRRALSEMPAPLSRMRTQW